VYLSSGSRNTHIAYAEIIHWNEICKGKTNKEAVYVGPSMLMPHEAVVLSCSQSVDTMLMPHEAVVLSCSQSVDTPVSSLLASVS
jgi:hypothetical protein